MNGADSERAAGRQGRSELPELLEQLRELDVLIGSRLQATIDPSAVISHAREMYFLGEAIAHTIQRSFIAICMERRYGMPATDADVFRILVDQGRLDLALARRLRQFLELRFLSSRPLARIDDAGVQELLGARAEFVRAVMDLAGAERA